MRTFTNLLAAIALTVAVKADNSGYDGFCRKHTANNPYVCARSNDGSLRNVKLGENTQVYYDENDPTGLSKFCSPSSLTLQLDASVLPPFRTQNSY